MLVFMTRTCNDEDFELIWSIINDGAQAYQGNIPADCWTEPYMSKEKLRHEIDAGVVFHVYEDIGVMGLQYVQDVILIRHAYVRTDRQRKGIGARLLTHLCESADRPILIGTWADATWAIRFYEKHGFRLVTGDRKDRLLRKYWDVPERQMETSVALAQALPPLVDSSK